MNWRLNVFQKKHLRRKKSCFLFFLLQEGTNVACHIDERGKLECRGVFL